MNETMNIINKEIDKRSNNLDNFNLPEKIKIKAIKLSNSIKKNIQILKSKGKMNDDELLKIYSTDWRKILKTVDERTEMVEDLLEKAISAIENKTTKLLEKANPLAIVTKTKNRIYGKLGIDNDTGSNSSIQNITKGAIDVLLEMPTALESIILDFPGFLRNISSIFTKDGIINLLKGIKDGLMSFTDIIGLFRGGEKSYKGGQSLMNILLSILPISKITGVVSKFIKGTKIVKKGAKIASNIAKKLEPATTVIKNTKAVKYTLGLGETAYTGAKRVNESIATAKSVVKEKAVNIKPIKYISNTKVYKKIDNINKTSHREISQKNITEGVDNTKALIQTKKSLNRDINKMERTKESWTAHETVNEGVIKNPNQIIMTDPNDFYDETYVHKFNNSSKKRQIVMIIPKESRKKVMDKINIENSIKEKSTLLNQTTNKLKQNIKEAPKAVVTGASKHTVKSSLNEAKENVTRVGLAPKSPII